MANRFKMPPYDPADESSLQYALDQTELFLNTAIPALEGGIVLHVADPSSVTGSTTTSTADPMTAVVSNMSITADFGGYPLLFFWSALMQNNTAGATTRSALHVDGTEVFASRRATTHGTANGVSNHSLSGFYYQPAAGSRTMTMRWHVSSGTGTVYERQFVIAELRNAA